MQTKLTLDEAWEKSLKMWKWIAECPGDDDTITNLKDTWLRENGYFQADLISDCFFCHYAGEDSNGITKCKRCPANKVLSSFSCEDDNYDWAYNPVAFYNKLVELNEIRLKNN